MHFRLLYVLADLCLAGLNKSTGSIIQDIQCPGKGSNRSSQNRRHKIYRQSQTVRPIGYSKIRNSQSVWRSKHSSGSSSSSSVGGCGNGDDGGSCGSGGSNSAVLVVGLVAGAVKFSTDYVFSASSFC